MSAAIASGMVCPTGNVKKVCLCSEGYIRTLDGRHAFLKIIFSLEMSFVLFVFSGIFKNWRVISWFPVDLTLFFGATSCVAGLLVCLYSPQPIWMLKAKAPYVALFSLFVGYLGLSWIWSPSEHYAREKVFNLMTLDFWGFVCPLMIITANEYRIRKFLKALFFVALFVCAASLLPSRTATTEDVGFSTVLGARYLNLALVLMTGPVYVFFGGIGRAKRSGQFAFFWLLSVAFFVALLDNGARAPLLFCILAMADVFLCSMLSDGWDGKIGKRKVYALFLFLALLAVLAGYAHHNPRAASVYRIQHAIETEGGGASVQVREHALANSYSFWLERPFWGHGVGAWPLLNGDGDRKNYPHNRFVEVLVEGGIVGFLLWILLIGRTLRPTIMRSRHLRSEWYQQVTALYVMALLCSLTMGSIDSRNFFCFLGMMIGSDIYRKKPHGSSLQGDRLSV